MGRGLTSRRAGVDIDLADRFVERIGRSARRTHGRGVISGVGLFAAATTIPKSFRRPVLLTSADGVGTKLLVAQAADRHDTIGIDLVAMNANDILTSGATPLYFLDYLATGRLATIDADAIVGGIVEGCVQAGMGLVGGETAEMPGLYADGVYDLAGFAIGACERRRLLDGSRVRAGDVVVGLESSGLHSNGYSLARRALGIAAGRRASRPRKAVERARLERLLVPTRIYVKPVLAALERFRVRAMAHITGGGLPGNLPRVLPKGLRADIERRAMPEPEVFEEIRRAGRISREEMDRTFNCGIGFALVTGRSEADAVCAFFRRRRVPARVIGRIVRGRGGVAYRD